MRQNPIHEQQLTEGLLYQHFEPHVHCLTFTDMSNKVVDAAYEKITTLNAEYADNEQHLQFLHILDDASYTPYMLLKITQALRTIKDNLQHSTAAVADTFLAGVLETIIVPKIGNKIRNATQFFTTEKEALSWLADRRKTQE